MLRIRKSQELLFAARSTVAGNSHGLQVDNIKVLLVLMLIRGYNYPQE